MSQPLWNIARRSSKVAGASPHFGPGVINEQPRRQGRRSAAASLLFASHLLSSPRAAQTYIIVMRLCYETTQNPHGGVMFPAGCRCVHVP